VLQAPQTQSEWAESKILMIEGQDDMMIVQYLKTIS
jgi:hypothetical protein